MLVTWYDARYTLISVNLSTLSPCLDNMYGVHNKMIRTKVRSTHEAAVLDVGTISAWVLK